MVQIMKLMSKGNSFFCQWYSLDLIQQEQKY